MSEVTYTTVNKLRVGSFILIDNVPCKVISIQTSAPGKHGAAKARIVGIGLLDGRRREIVKGTEDRVPVPVIEKKFAQVLVVERDENGKPVRAQIMDLDTYETFEASIDESVADKVEEGVEVQYWDIMGHKVIKQVRRNK